MLISMFNFPRERVEHYILIGLIALQITIIQKKEDKKDFTFQSKNIVFIMFPFLIFSIYLGLARFKGEYYLKKALNSRAFYKHSQVIENID